MYSATAWVLYAGAPGGVKSGNLVKERIQFAGLGAKEVLCEPIFGCWEANMSHALERQPIDVCRHRGEPKVVLGNAGVLRVLEIGPEVTTIRPGQYAIISVNGIEDQWGYTVKALGYDSPGQIGMLATRTKLTERQLAPIPDGTRYSLPQWAAFSARYVTAWSNWQLAYGVFRLQVDPDQCPNPHVWGWGGGTTLAELSLARRYGCRVAMLSGQDRNLRSISAYGINAVDRRQFGELSWDEDRYAHDADYRRKYRDAEESFIQLVQRLTENEMVQIFVDNIGSPVYRATLRALSREGIITTAGWKKGMKLSYLRAQECISRHQHIHTHYASYSQCLEAVSYAEKTGWMPEKPRDIFGFHEIPELARKYSEGSAGYFPCFAINPE